MKSQPPPLQWLDWKSRRRIHCLWHDSREKPPWRIGTRPTTLNDFSDGKLCVLKTNAPLRLMSGHLTLRSRLFGRGACRGFVMLRWGERRRAAEVASFDRTNWQSFVKECACVHASGPRNRPICCYQDWRNLDSWQQYSTGFIMFLTRLSSSSFLEARMQICTRACRTPKCHTSSLEFIWRTCISRPFQTPAKFYCSTQHGALLSLFLGFTKHCRHAKCDVCEESGRQRTFHSGQRGIELHSDPVGKFETSDQ